MGVAPLWGVSMKLTILCGRCDSECKVRLDEEDGNLVVTCPQCMADFKKNEKQIGDLEDEIFELQKQGAA